MIKTYKHKISELLKRDNDINLFCIENKVFATQTNIINDDIITTIFYDSKTR